MPQNFPVEFNASCGYDGAMYGSRSSHHLRLALVSVLLVGLVFLSSCSVHQEISLDENLSGRWTARGEAAAFAAEAFDDLALVGGYNSASELYDAALLEAEVSFLLRPDVEEVSLTMIDGHAWEAEMEFLDIRSLMGQDEQMGLVDISSNGAENILTFTMDRDRAGRIETLIPFLKDPALSLFNPAGTENIDEETYIRDILGFTFGENHLDAIRAASVTLIITLPGPITRVQNGRRIDERTVEFVAPISRFLVPETGVRWLVAWESP